METPNSSVAETAAAPLSSADRARVRSAMLSIYYQASARTYRVSGAPAVVLPPDVQLDSLGRALRIVHDLDPARMREALWLVVRNERVRGHRHGYLERYDEEAVPFLAPTGNRKQQIADLHRLADLRREYRSRGNILGTVLTACRDHDFAQLPGLLTAYRSFDTAHPGNDAAAATVAAMTLGGSAKKLFRLVAESRLSDNELEPYRDLVHAIETDVGRPISAYVDDLAAAAAFKAYCDGLEPPLAASEGPLTIHPVSLAVSQDRATLTTTAVVSTYATGPLSALLAGTAPENWARTSDVIRRADYIADAYDFTPLDDRVANARLDEGLPVLLDEHAAVAWGRDGEAQSAFHNVLRISREVRKTPGPLEPSIDIRYSLCRSVDSQVLWDRQAGGMDLNEGYYSVWPLGHHQWRISVRKHLRFSDRTPATSSSQDLGQSLNFLAPASITWWLETETYNLSRYRAGDGDSPPSDGSGAEPQEEMS